MHLRCSFFGSRSFLFSCPSRNSPIRLQSIAWRAAHQTAQWQSNTTSSHTCTRPPVQRRQKVLDPYNPASRSYSAALMSLVAHVSAQPAKISLPSYLVPCVSDPQTKTRNTSSLFSTSKPSRTAPGAPPRVCPGRHAQESPGRRQVLLRVRARASHSTDHLGSRVPPRT